MLPIDHDHASSDRDGPRSGRRLALVGVVLGVFVLLATVSSVEHDVGDEIRLVPAKPVATAATTVAEDDTPPVAPETPLRPALAPDVMTAMLCKNALRAGVATVLMDNALWNKRPPTETDAPGIADEPNAPPVPPHEAAAPVLYFNQASMSLEEQLPSGTAAMVRRVCRDKMALQGIQVSFKRFDRNAAFKCLAGKNIVFYGNSNTRTLYTALESLLRGTRQIGRVAAKQRCDNSKKNHSCATRIDLEGHASIDLFYWGYVKDIYHPSLHTKMVKSGQIQRADIVIGNAGVNVIQGTPDGQWEKVYEDATVFTKFTDFAAAVKPGGQLWWHTTTRLCDHQKHFTRYKYDPRYWSGRSLTAVNAAVTKSNYLASRVFNRVDAVLEQRNVSVVGYLDGNRLVEEGGAATNGLSGGVCPYFDDPLHHRFLDRELVQILLNAWCF